MKKESNDSQAKLSEGTYSNEFSENPLSGNGIACIFCSIIREEVPSFMIYRDEVSIAFLDSRPVFLGHTLLVPISHLETLHDIPLDIIAPLFTNVKLLSIAVQRSLRADGTLIAINNRISQSVPHMHVHIIPRRAKDGLKGFFWPRRKYTDDGEAIGMQNTIKKELESVRKQLLQTTGF